MIGPMYVERLCTSSTSATTHCAWTILGLKPGVRGEIILPVVLYGSKTWSLTIREEHRLRMFENRVLRRISGSKRDEVTAE
jgi:hypothetical protein